MTIVNYLSVYRIFAISACLLIAGTLGREALVGGETLRAFCVFMPYPISLQYPLHNHACGGGLIRNKFILTAARCVVDQNNEFIRGQLDVLVKSSNLNVILPPAKIVQVKRVYVPKEYNPRTNNGDGDIAVLELREEFRHPGRSDNNTHWLELSRDHNNEDTDHKIVTITGFGWTQISMGRRHNVIGDSNGCLKFARVDVFGNDECRKVYQHHRIINTDKYFCAKIVTLSQSNEPHGVCNGDTGGLLVRGGGGVEATVVGVLSIISPNCDERLHPAIYTRVSHYREFIERALAGKVSASMRMHEVPQPLDYM